MFASYKMPLMTEDAFFLHMSWIYCQTKIIIASHRIHSMKLLDYKNILSILLFAFCNLYCMNFNLASVDNLTSGFCMSTVLALSRKLQEYKHSYLLHVNSVHQCRLLRYFMSSVYCLFMHVI